MKNRTILKSIIIILVLIEGISLYLLYKPTKENILANVKVEDILKDKNKTLAIKVQDDTFNWSDAGTSTTWPSRNTHYYYGTNCVDETGTDLGTTKQIVQFDDQSNTATITTKKTIYCTIYFAIKKNALELMQSKTDASHLKQVEGIEGGDELIRYVGTKDEITNNYICFGTSNIDACKTNPDAYMYRIIGIQNKDNDTLGLKTNQLKIIKATPVKEGSSVKTLKWATDGTTSYCGSSTAENGKCQWDYASAAVSDGPEARWYLNNTFLNTITGTTGGKDWKDLISNPKWYKGDNPNATRASGGTKEVATPTSTGFKVGLMYASDYYNSWTYASNANSWLFITNGWTGNPSQVEWTMTRFGYGTTNRAYFAWGVVTVGRLSNPELLDRNAVRPVFYVSPDIKLSGEGRADSPFIITV